MACHAGACEHCTDRPAGRVAGWGRTQTKAPRACGARRRRRQRRRVGCIALDEVLFDSPARPAGGTRTCGRACSSLLYFVPPRRDRDDPRAVALLALGCLLCPSFCSLVYSKYLFASFLRGERSSTRPLKLSQEMESGHGTQDSTQKHGRTAEGEKQWRAAARRRNKEEGEEKDFFLARGGTCRSPPARFAPERAGTPGPVIGACVTAKRAVRRPRWIDPMHWPIPPTRWGAVAGRQPLEHLPPAATQRSTQSEPATTHRRPPAPRAWRIA